MHRKNSRVIPALALARHILAVMALAAFVAAAVLLAFSTVSQANAATSTAWQVKSVMGLASTVGHPATPAQEWAACTAAYHFRHVNAKEHGNERLWQSAYHAAVRAASYADAGMHYDIDHYLFTGQGWEHIAYDCHPDA